MAARLRRRGDMVTADISIADNPVGIAADAVAFLRGGAAERCSPRAARVASLVPRWAAADVAAYTVSLYAVLLECGLVVGAQNRCAGLHVPSCQLRWLVHIAHSCLLRGLFLWRPAGGSGGKDSATQEASCTQASGQRVTRGGNL